MEVKELDCLYEACPVPLIKAIRELKTMKPGDILVLKSDQSCVGAIVEEWGEQNNYPVKVVELECGDFEVYIQKS
ncbi:MAG: sulfurtransferase TusA family protein [Clostridium lundense]|nr:sulfurtransferase TusA family protein [Clostridium lundense]